MLRCSPTPVILLKFFRPQLQSNWLSPKARPEEVKYWIARGRKYSKPPIIKSLATFMEQCCRWWACLQPVCRRDPDNPWPLLKETPEDASAWSDVKRGGCNGLFMVVMCLSWWLGAAEDDEDIEELREIVEDVKWVITVMVPEAASQDPAVSTPSGAEAPPSASATPRDDGDKSATPRDDGDKSATPRDDGDKFAAPCDDGDKSATPRDDGASATPRDDSDKSAPSASASSGSSSPDMSPSPSSVVAATDTPIVASGKSSPASAPSSSVSAAPETTITARPVAVGVAPAPMSEPSVVTPTLSAVSNVAGAKRASPEPEHDEAPAAKKVLTAATTVQG